MQSETSLSPKSHYQSHYQYQSGRHYIIEMNNYHIPTHGGEGVNSVHGVLTMAVHYINCITQDGSMITYNVLVWKD